MPSLQWLPGVVAAAATLCSLAGGAGLWLAPRWRARRVARPEGSPAGRGDRTRVYRRAAGPRHLVRVSAPAAVEEIRDA